MDLVLVLSESWNIKKKERQRVTHSLMSFSLVYFQTFGVK